MLRRFFSKPMRSTKSKRCEEKIKNYCNSIHLDIISLRTLCTHYKFQQILIQKTKLRIVKKANKVFIKVKKYSIEHAQDKLLLQNLQLLYDNLIHELKEMIDEYGIKFFKKILKKLEKIKFKKSEGGMDLKEMPGLESYRTKSNNENEIPFLEVEGLSKPFLGLEPASIVAIKKPPLNVKSFLTLRLKPMPGPGLEKNIFRGERKVSTFSSGSAVLSPAPVPDKYELTTDIIKIADDLIRQKFIYEITKRKKNFKAITKLDQLLKRKIQEYEEKRIFEAKKIPKEERNQFEITFAEDKYWRHCQLALTIRQDFSALFLSRSSTYGMVTALNSPPSPRPSSLLGEEERRQELKPLPLIPTISIPYQEITIASETPELPGRILTTRGTTPPVGESPVLSGAFLRERPATSEDESSLLFRRS